jgi:N-acetylglucosamine kinase-like BadF-type ATPase
VAGSDDEIAREVLRNAGRELAELAAVVIRRLFVQEEMTVPVAITGGVFRHAEIVRQVFYNELRKLEPRAEVNPQVVDPVDGALRIARRAGS